jgi:hypothetical protein
MANTVLIKRSGTANAVPASGNISLGELAINYADGLLFYKNAAGNVVVLANSNVTNTGSSQIVNGTSNVVVAPSGNVTVGIAGTNVATFATTGLSVTGIVSVTGNVQGGNIRTAGLISASWQPHKWKRKYRWQHYRRCNVWQLYHGSKCSSGYDNRSRGLVHH